MKNYIVLDLEWNQCPAGRDASVEHLPFEIFEIGAVKLNEKMESVSEFHRLIKPCVYRRLHYIISEVTHVSSADLARSGEPFDESIRDFIEWCGEDYVFCTWGNMDILELQRNMVYHGIELPFAKPLLFYDVQKLYSLLYSDGKTRESLDRAVVFFSLESNEPFHRALVDAEYTAKILARIDFETVKEYVSVDYFQLPESREEEFTLEFPNYSKYVSQLYPSRDAALADKRITDMICYKCHRMLRKKIRWFSCGQRYHLCLAVCPEHGLVKGKIRLKKAENGEFFAVRTEKLVDEGEAELIAKKKSEIKLRNAERNKKQSRTQP